MKKRSLNKIKQMVSIGMSCIMAGSTCNLPMMLHAEEVQTENMKPTYMVTSFDELNEEIAYQALSIGAEESEINFPDTLKVKVIRQVEEEPSTEADEEESSTEAVEEEASTEAEEETASKALESQTEAESQTESESEVESGTETEVKPQTEVESQTEIESELRTEVELLTEVENETLESESETEVPMTETEVPETTAASEPQTQVPETTASESETESTEQLESDTTEEESSIVASLIDSIKGLFAPVEVYAAEEYITYSAGEGNGAEDSQEGEEWTIEHITWKLDEEKSSLPEFDSSEESAGAVYIYTPTIPETDENGNHYILSEEATLPEIYVMVDCVDNGIVLYSSNILASGTCGAEGNNGDNLTWILDDEGVLTISGTGAMASWNWKGSPWYANKDKIESVVIEDGVTSIGANAFDGCSGLTSITIPSSVTSIGEHAFYGCSGLTSITIPSSVTSIGAHAFWGCSGLTSITIPSSVTSIEKYVFSGCSGLTSITIPNSVTSIEWGAFSGCSGLTSITIPSSVTSIGEGAFEGCSGLTSITIPSSVTSIGKYAFSGCSGLTSITIPSSVTSIGAYAFRGCSGLTSITIPSSVTSIGEYTFYGCSGLTSITIPNSVTSIGTSAFSGCSGLTRVIYLGIEERWNNLTIESDNDYCLKAAKIFHLHTHANDLAFNATYHWYQCTDEACPVKDEPQAQDGCALHEWKNGEATYKWSADNQKCTAERKCTACGNVESETASTTSQVVQKKNCTLPELTTYSAKFKNDAFKQQTKENVQTAAAIGHDLEKVAQKNASCTETGYEAYWRCKKCAKLFSDEAGTHEIINPVEINANGHALKKVEKKAPTCTGIGYEAYWKCSKCAKLFSDEAGTHEINNPVEINANGHDLKKVEKKEAGCTETGHEAYWKCKNCAKLFSDEAGTHEISKLVEINANGHNLEKVEKKEASCTETGYEAYWKCSKCAKLFSDETGTHEISKPVEINASGHDLKKVEKKAPTCTEIGWEAYNTCKRDGCNYTTYKELPKLNHDLEHHEAKAATCTEIGWEAYDICKRDGCKYTTYKELPALGHEDSNNDHLCDACSTKISDHSYESKIAREATTTYTGIRIYTCTKCGHSYTEELAKLPSQTNQADQTNQIELANNGNEKDFIGTVTSVFLNVTNFAAKNFIISFWLMIQMLLKAIMQLW